ncbi:hypothetical protein PV10_06619 [Exophiala mesophila]|uniref:PhoD-like phosphatase metallophosphatase domain-containing protein n=1 Tax=Exophiala mesophila TaxID=212818 RepID=A0A0D1ZZ87_EXOME|nr:uncharacterized protein PV10_06619 [Exophiala mesophila]KIV92158.1 hypothetical protein PV10_06619 [Exophiala mesophila]
MPSTAEWVAGLSSTITRISAYSFLRWIPGHHFPPIILSSLIVYLFCVFGNSEAFGAHRPTLHQAFPRLFPHPEPETKEPVTGQELQDHQEPILYEDEKSFFKILVLGIPKWRDAQWSYITIAVNVLLAGFTLDLVFRAPLLYPSRDLTFSRVGYVHSDYAKVLIREPNSTQLPLHVYLSLADKTNWKTVDTIHTLDQDTDYTYPITFRSLQPSTKYIYSLSNDLSGVFTTAPAPKSEAARSLTFVTSSCIKANFPYQAKAHALAIHGFEHLSSVIQALPSPAAFMMFLGDFIYIDVPQRLSSSVRHYRSEYRRVYASPSWKLPGLDTLPWIHTLDDHEIANDWSGGNETDPFPAAADPFIQYHVSVNPPVPKGASSGPDTNTTYFQFTNGPASFFMLDTRRYRTDPESSKSTTSSTMLGDVQLASLLKYLADPEPRHVHWKIIASSVPFTKNWRFGTPDTWGGFLTERSQILAAMHKAERDLGVRVIVLSGDRHEFAAIRYPPPVSSIAQGSNDTQVFDQTPSSGPHEFSVGPLSMFYLPFRTFKQIDDEDVAIQYLPDGNSKLGVVEIHPLVGGVQRSSLKYKLFVDGKLTWEYNLTSPAAGYQGGRGARWWLWE